MVDDEPHNSRAPSPLRREEDLLQWTMRAARWNPKPIMTRRRPVTMETPGLLQQSLKPIIKHTPKQFLDFLALYSHFYNIINVVLLIQNWLLYFAFSLPSNSWNIGSIGQKNIILAPTTCFSTLLPTPLSKNWYKYYVYFVLWSITIILA